MSHLQPLPVWLPVVGEGSLEVAHGRAATVALDGPDDQVVEGELAYRLEAFGDDGLFDPSLGL